MHFLNASNTLLFDPISLLFLKLQLVGEECSAYNEDAALDVW